MTYLLRPEEYSKLTQNQSYIRENMDSDFMLRVMDRFYEGQLVTYQVHQDFNEIRLTSEQAATLLDLLITGNSYRYEAFCDFCQEEHREMYDRLFISDYNAVGEPATTTVTDSDSGDSPSGGVVNNAAVSRCSSPPSTLVNLDTQSPRIPIQVIPVIFPQIRAKIYKTKTVYTPSFPVRGIALLFFNVEFSDRNFPARTGAEHDMENLSRLFHDLNYNVKVLRNATRDEVLKELEYQRQNRLHHQLGSFILGFSTHGGNASKSIVCSDGKSIYIHDIYEYFDSKNCPYLAGKPKFIFFDASSGCARDRAVPINKPMEPPRKFESVKKQLSIHFSLGNIKMSSVRPLKVSENYLRPLSISSAAISKPSCRVADKSDLIVAMSTFDGYVSWRRNSHGCWFSRVLVEVFQKHACDHHLIQLLKLVRQKMSYIETKSRYKQVNMTIDTSLKQFYFFPGINTS